MKPDRLRAIAIAEWRGMSQAPFPRDTSQTVRETLAKVMASLGLKDRLREDEVLKAWGEVVGEFIAGQSCPQSLKDGVLNVRVLQPAVHFELDRVWKTQILEKFKERFGPRTVKVIKFRVG